MSGAPRPRPDPEAHAVGAKRRHGHRPEGRAARRHGRLPRPRHARACRSSARSCTTRSTSSPPTGSSAPTSSRTRRWTDAYRGAGRPEATFAIERIMDELAVELGRRPDGDPRARTGSSTRSSRSRRWPGSTYDTGNYEAATAKAMELFGYDELRARAGRAPRAQGPGPARHRHLDVHRDVRAGAVAGARVRCATPPAAGSTPSIRMLPTGKVEVVTGTSPHGQGHETAWSQIVADRLGVPFEDIEVLHGDTQISPTGLDTYGSRSLAVGGIAVVKAGRQGDREGQADRGAPARGQRRRPRVRRRHVQRQGHRPGRRRIGGPRVRGVRGARPARRRRADAGRRRDVRPGELLLPARHAPVRGRGRHRDRCGRRSASTSASTTSARWSTR